MIVIIGGPIIEVLHVDWGGACVLILSEGKIDQKLGQSYHWEVTSNVIVTVVNTVIVCDPQVQIIAR